MAQQLSNNSGWWNIIIYPDIYIYSIYAYNYYNHYNDLQWYTYIYIYMWVNYNDLTATSLESWLGFGESSPNGPTIIQQFRLVKYYNLPIYINIYIYSIYTYNHYNHYNDLQWYTHIYIYIWVNYNDLTATSLESWLGFGESSPNGPTIIQQFRLVKYYI